MNQGNRRPTGPDTHITINGHALRTIRILVGPSITDLAREITETPAAAEAVRTYISHIEHGRKDRISPALFNQIVKALGVDRRALLANPHADLGQVAA